MGQQVLVYDENTECFRSLNTRNYNDDIIVGTIFFKKGAISVLKKYFTICGYVLINKYEKFPIDIRNDEIALLEGTYNCMPEKVKSELVKYNLIEKPEVIWSYFFFQWQFMCNWDAFNSDSFIELASRILGNKQIIKRLIDNKFDMVFPTTYLELCEFAQGTSKIFQMDFFNPEYKEDVNYVFDSLVKGYHIKMELYEIEMYCRQICTILNQKWEELT